MKLTFVLRNKKNALKISTKTIESFMERIKRDTKDGAVARRRKQLSYGDFMSGYDSQYPTHLVYPSAVFEKDDNENLRMKTFNGVVALTIDGLDDQEVDAVKRAAQILHYTLAAFVGPSEHEVIILVKIAKADSAYSPISGGYSEITQPYSTILPEYSEIVRKKTKLLRKKSKIVSENSELTEEEADVICQEGHRLAATLYQSIMPKPIKTEPVSVKSCFHMPLDATPYYNPKAVALPVSKKPTTAQPLGVVMNASDNLGDESSDKEAQEIKRPYGRHVEDFPRRASFIATTNQADVLADPSGSRRFLSVELTGPIDVSTPPNYEQLYAQAMQALHRHEPYYFGPTETQQIIEWNKRFSMKTAAEQFFSDYFEPAADETEGEWTSSSAIFEHLKQKVGVSLLKPANVSYFGRLLSNIPALQKRETKYGSVYLVKQKKPK